MTVSINGTSGIVFNDASSQNTAATGFGFKNRIINGAMVIDQRNAGASVTPADSAYTLDRWKARLTQSAKYSVQQSTTAPTGFANSLLVTSLSAYTVGASDFFFVTQLIEGFNAADLAWGTASAATVTLSFWVRSSLTGTFGGSVRAGGTNRSYPFTYTISSANTWEQKSITVAGDTSGSWPTTNTTWGEIDFGLGAGSTFSGTAGTWAGLTYVSATGATSVVGTNGATFYITGIQLEKGSTATSFDYRPYGTELALCQRYYSQITYPQTSYVASGKAFGGTSAMGFLVPLPVTMRSAPTGNSSGLSSLRVLDSVNSSNSTVSTVTMSNPSVQTISFYIGLASSILTAGQATTIDTANGSAFTLTASAEL